MVIQAQFASQSEAEIFCKTVSHPSRTISGFHTSSIVSEADIISLRFGLLSLSDQKEILNALQQIARDLEIKATYEVVNND